MSFSFDIETLLEPISADAVCGASLLHDPAIQAIKASRREDDPSLPAGVWQTELKVADWAAVEALCVDLLTEKSKDLMVAAWLAEAWLRRYGWEALPTGFGLIAALCERFWDALHPLPRDGDWGYRVAPIAWVAGQFPGLLAGRIDLCESVEKQQTCTLAQWESTRRLAIALADRKDVPAARRDEVKREADALEASARATAQPALIARLRAVGAVKTNIERFDVWCTQQLGNEAPAFGALIDVLERVRVLLNEWVPQESILTTNQGILSDISIGTVESKNGLSPGGGETQSFVPTSRESAYRQLALIGEFLMRYEPHSPVPYMIQRALKWGEMPLPELLQQLTEAGRGQMLGAALGLLPAERKES